MEQTLRARFDTKKDALEEEQKDTTIFNWECDQWNLMLSRGAADHWKVIHATREMVTNWYDEAVKCADSFGAVVYKVSQNDANGVELALTPGGAPTRTFPLWSCTATLCGVEIGSIHFVFDDDDNLHGIWRNRFTCFHALKAYSNGFTTKKGDDTQSGRFGDGIISSTAVFNRTAHMWMITGGCMFGFKFVDQGTDSWLIMEKEKAPTKSGCLATADSKDTVFHVKWPAREVGGGLSDVFIPQNFLYFSEVPLNKLDLTEDGKEALIFDDAYRGGLYVADVFVCKVYGFEGFGLSSMKLKEEMNRDRSSISSWVAQRQLKKSVVAYLTTGKDATRIYDTIDTNDYAFSNLNDVGDGGEWNKALSAVFIKRHPNAYPYANNDAGDRALIERELGLEAVPVGGNLYKTLCGSGVFETVDVAVTRKFVADGRPVEWSDESRTVRDRISGMIQALHEAGGCDEDLADYLEIGIRDVKSRFAVRICIDDDVLSGDYYRTPANHAKLYLRWDVVNNLTSDGAKPGDFRGVLFEVYGLLMEHNLADLDHESALRFVSRIANFAEGDFKSEPEPFCDALEDDSDVGGGNASPSPTQGRSKRKVSDDSDVGGGNAPTQGRGKGKVSDNDFGARGYHSDDDDTDVVCPSPAKRPRVDLGPVTDRKLGGDFKVPLPASVPNSEVQRTGALSRPPPSHDDDVEHGFRGNLALLENGEIGTGDEYEAVFYTSSNWMAPPDGGLYHQTARNVRALLHGVFEWDDAITFGVYQEQSDTLAFTRNGNQLFVNAYFGAQSGALDHVWYYFALLCHEITHICGYGAHDVNFANALTRVTMQYQPKLVEYLMVQHTGADCGVDCLVEHKHTCSKHCAAPLDELRNDDL